MSLLVGFAIFSVLPGDDDKFKLSMATGYVAFAFLVATLVVGPLSVLRRTTLTLSDDLRRDVGIWAAGLGIVHVIVGIQIHMGSGWLYFIYGPGEAPQRWPLPIRIDAFGLANHVGLLATLILVLLLLLSNDISMRALGNIRWKRLQQLNYALLALVVAHGVLYQRVEQRGASWIVLFGALWLFAVGMQLSGYCVRRSRGSSRIGISTRPQIDQSGLNK